ncbi:MAG: hypothetical protein QG573_815 [Acidobacteriota bacterium]|nr:hypothetical protein [Acidobacteriota bacterium]
MTQTASTPSSTPSPTLSRSAASRIFSTALFCAAVCALSLVAVAAAADLDPAKTVTLADVEKVLGGKFTSRSPEPGVLFYEEDGGSRQVNIYLWPVEYKSIATLTPTLVGNGEPVEEIAGLGDAAIYRPQGNEALVEVQNAAHGLIWLTVTVHNVDSPADTKRIALDLAKRGAARL